MRLVGGSDDPPALLALQTLVGAVGTAAAVGSWRERRWAPIAALAHGATTAAMLLSLEPVLGLPREARGGLWTAAAFVLLFGTGAAWYLRRRVAVARDDADASMRHE